MLPVQIADLANLPKSVALCQTEHFFANSREILTGKGLLTERYCSPMNWVEGVDTPVLTDATLSPRAQPKGRVEHMLTFILPVFLLIALVAVLPIWRHSKKWSFYPLGGLSLLILIVLFLFWTGRF